MTETIIRMVADEKVPEGRVLAFDAAGQVVFIGYLCDITERCKDDWRTLVLNPTNYREYEIFQATQKKPH